jgi:hypothetical protein
MRPRSASFPNPADLLGGSFGFSLDLSPTPRVHPHPEKQPKSGKEETEERGDRIKQNKGTSQRRKGPIGFGEGK